ncbi:MAG: ATP-binding cassette domain-containing protein [Lachnospiraceae bacterium]|nr:ATP-binding cassette domain-containing protein [Lachnospiraceae bacterium]
MSNYLVETKGLRVWFPAGGSLGKKSFIHAVDGVDLQISRGETFGLVGESGCGKSTLGRTILGLYEPMEGEVIYDGQKLDLSEMPSHRKKLQMIFQDPSASLNPRMRIGDIVEEPMINFSLHGGSKERQEKVLSLFSLVGLTKEQYHRYPHEFSGGQQQRVGIARTLATEPEFIVCDEPVSALDVSIQSQIINLLEDMQDQLALTYLFIAHDVSVVRHISDRIGVMFLGRLVEVAEAEELVKNPLHPYTKALIGAVPIPDPDKAKQKQRTLLEGELPSPVDPPPGCRFKTRCPYRKDCGGKCDEILPELKETAPGHFVSCHLYGN